MSVLTFKSGGIYNVASVAAFTTEPVTEDGATAIYQIDDTSIRIWDPNTAVEASSGTIDKAWMDNGVDYFTGRIKMTEDGLVGLKVDGAAATLQAVGEVHRASISITQETQDDTVIGDTWHTKKVLGKDATVTLERYRTDTEFDNTTHSNWVLLRLNESSTGGYWCKALRTGLTVSKSMGAIDSESVTLDVSGPISRI